MQCKEVSDLYLLGISLAFICKGYDIITINKVKIVIYYVAGNTNNSYIKKHKKLACKFRQCCS